MTRQLRDYQLDDLAAVRAEWSSGVTRTAVVAATGLGKGDLIAKLVTDEVTAGGRALILTHRAEIMGQIAARCPLYLPGVKVGQVQAERNEIRRAIVIAMVPTLAARLRGAKDAETRLTELTTKYERGKAERELVRRQARLPQKPTLIVADECFPAGTMVGGIPIEQLRPGDSVPSWHEGWGEPRSAHVSAVMRSVPSGLVRVVTDLDEVVCTPGHRFLTWDGWVPAADLMSLHHAARRIITGRPLPPREYGSWRQRHDFKPVSARVERVDILEPGSDGTYGGVCPGGVVYNLEVEGTHTYQVGGAGLVVHNCHHAAADSWMKVLRWAGAFDHVRTLGLTATLVRGDRKGLGDVWESVAAERDIGWAVENGWLVKPRGRAVVADHVDLEHAKISKGDYQDNELGEMVEQDTAQIVAAWREHAADRITVAFTPTVSSAVALRDEFTATGIPVGLVVGTTSPEQRTRAYARLATGQDRVLVNVMVATEGFDCPPVSCILMARPTRLPGLLTQIIGRGLRLHPESGKTDCLVFDVVGASRHQKLATLVDLYKSAEYDDSELEMLPEVCPVCDLIIGPVEDIFQQCQCSPNDEPGGGGAVRDGRRRLIGPVTYEDVDLFARSELVWLFTKAGTRFLPAGDRIAVLWDNEDDTYAPWHCSTKRYGGEPAECISEREDLDYGRRLAESWAMLYASDVARRGASWRTRGGRGTEKQIQLAQSLGIISPETMTKPRLSDEISIVLASRILD